MIENIKPHIKELRKRLIISTIAFPNPIRSISFFRSKRLFFSIIEIKILDYLKRALLGPWIGSSITIV